MENVTADKAIITTSWDDGHPLDWKLAELLKKYDIPATFYIPVKNVERECMNPRQMVEIAQSFDVGEHTYHHFDLTRISLQEAESSSTVKFNRLGLPDDFHRRYGTRQFLQSDIGLDAESITETLSEMVTK